MYRIFTNNSPWGVINSECLRHGELFVGGVNCGGVNISEVISRKFRITIHIAKAQFYQQKAQYKV